MTTKNQPHDADDEEASKTVKMSAVELRKQLHELGVDVDAHDDAEKPTSASSSSERSD